MKDRTTLDEIRAALESPPPVPRMPPTSGGSVRATGDSAVAMTAPPTDSRTPDEADVITSDVDAVAREADAASDGDAIASHDETSLGAGRTTPDAQVRNQPMDRTETTDRGGTTATATPATTPADSGPANGTAGLSTADMAAAGTSGTADTAGTAARASSAATPAAAPAATPATAQPAAGPEETPLFASDQASSLRTRWQDIQTGFVDEPRSAVQNADALVAEAMQQLAAMFADERRALEQQWSEGQQISTEDLRIALQRYRSFFNRLLAI